MIDRSFMNFDIPPDQASQYFSYMRNNYRREAGGTEDRNWTTPTWTDFNLAQSSVNRMINIYCSETDYMADMINDINQIIEEDLSPLQRLDKCFSTLKENENYNGLFFARGLIERGDLTNYICRNHNIIRILYALNLCAAIRKELTFFVNYKVQFICACGENWPQKLKCVPRFHGRAALYMPKSIYMSLAEKIHDRDYRGFWEQIFSIYSGFNHNRRLSSPRYLSNSHRTASRTQISSRQVSRGTRSPVIRQVADPNMGLIEEEYLQRSDSDAAIVSSSTLEELIRSNELSAESLQYIYSYLLSQI